MKQGDYVIIDEKINTHGVTSKSIKKRFGVFIKDYGRYIQILNPRGLRVSIMKCDIEKVVIEGKSE